MDLEIAWQVRKGKLVEYSRINNNWAAHTFSKLIFDGEKK